MKQVSLARRAWSALLLSPFLLATVSPATAATTATATAIDLADQPLFSTISVPGNVLLALSVEWPTATTPAYIYDNSTTATTTATNYSTSNTYLGYFDPAKCYKYVSVAVTTGSGSSQTTDYSTSYFAPYGSATSHACSTTASTLLWAGNYLNWASMQSLDEFRWILTGGYRSVDTTSSTILTKTYAGYDSSSVMPLKTLVSTAVAGATPFTTTIMSSGMTTRLRNIGSRMWFSNQASNTLLTGSATTGATAYTGQTLTSNTVYEVYINVKVCDSSVGVETNCVLYGSNYKPEGLMQQYAMKLRFSTFGYYDHDGTTTFQRDGGVMRARMKYIGPSQPVPGAASTTNSLAEWNATTGIMATNPDATDASDTVTFAANAGYTVSIVNSGAMNYLNKFGYSAKTYKSKDPVSELYYAGLRYYKHLGNVSSYTTLSNAGTGATGTANAVKWLDGFPAITTWDDPIVYACQKNFILGIGDVNTHRDANLPGSTLTASSSLDTPEPTEVSNDNTVDVAKATNMVGTLEGYSGSLANIFGDTGTTSCATTSSQCNSYYIAGLAYDSHVNDIRSDLDGVQTVNTYWMDVEENQVYKHKNQYWLAAKYGGFTVPSAFSAYDSGNGTSTIATTAWYTSSDTLARTTSTSVKATELSYSTDTSATAADKRPDNYFPGNQPDVMQTGLTKAFAKINGESAAANSTAFSTPTANLTESGSYSYAATYDPTDWTGKLNAYTVSFDDSGVVTARPAWDGRALLTSMDYTTRRIVTCCTSTGAGLPFTDYALTHNTLSSNTYYGSFALVPNVSTASQSASDYLLYLRGKAALEIDVSGGKYRARDYMLGDIVNSKPVAVNTPSQTYYDTTNPGYATYKSSKSTRSTVIYVGANDGMLHAFDGTSGAELFAYIPSFLYGTATSGSTTGTATTSGLAALGDPSSGFSHHYYVDATPAAFDLDLNKTSGLSTTTNDWRTLLIGGLGKGGKGYYALDISSVPASTDTETTIAGKVLWEFTDSTMGYSYGTPSVVKTAQYGWVVVFTSGYNNADGVGYFYFVNPRTGALLQKVSTPSGSTSSPINLGQHTAYVPDYTNFTADAVYGADLQGNIWRVDVTATSGNYPTPTLIATLTDASGNAQPVTTRPLIEQDTSSQARYVLVGTGRLLADTDISSSRVQSFYAIIDGLPSAGGFYTSGTGGTLPSGVTFPITRSKLTANTDLTLGVSTSTAGYMGWYFDMPLTNNIAQRVNIDPTALSGVIAWAGNTPNGSVCKPAGTGTTYATSYSTGKSVLLDSSGTITASIPDSAGVITDIAFLNVAGTIYLYSGDSVGNMTKDPANLSTTSGVKQLNWRDVPLAN